METLRRDAHAVNQQAAEKHLHGIQENRIDLALVLRNRNRGIALEQDAGQQQDDTPMPRQSSGEPSLPVPTISSSPARLTARLTTL